MSINVNCFDLVEVKYLNEKNESKVEFFSGYIDLAKEFIRNSKEKKIRVQSATFFIELMISESGSSTAHQPNKRFAEHEFSPEEFLVLSNDWVENIRISVNKEIDSYMAEHHGSTFQP